MSTSLDTITDRPIRQWKLSPPEIIVAENGYVLRTYDVVNDGHIYAIAATADEVRARLTKWADDIAAQLKSAVERELGKVA